MIILRENRISLSRCFCCVESDEQCSKWGFRGGIPNIHHQYQTSKQTQTSAVYTLISLEGDGCDRLYEHHTTGVLAKQIVYRWRRNDCFYNYPSPSKASLKLETPIRTVHHYSWYYNGMLYDSNRVRILLERDFYSVVSEFFCREPFSLITWSFGIVTENVNIPQMPRTRYILLNLASVFSKFVAKANLKFCSGYC